MSLSNSAIQDLRNHWAVCAIDAQDLVRAEKLAEEHLVQLAGSEAANISLVDRVALAYEVAANEGLDQLTHAEGDNSKLRDQAIAACYKAFAFRSLMPVPEHEDDRMFGVLKLSAMAYCGQRNSDLKNWYQDNEAALAVPEVDGTDWDKRLLIRIFDCWIKLFRRKQGQDDLGDIAQIFATLRSEQGQFEQERLDASPLEEGYSIAFRLVALYHWAKATDLLAEYLLYGTETNPATGIDRHFKSAIRSAEASRDFRHELILRWLHATSRQMIANSLWQAAPAAKAKTSAVVRSV